MYTKGKEQNRHKWCAGKCNNNDRHRTRHSICMRLRGRRRIFLRYFREFVRWRAALSRPGRLGSQMEKQTQPYVASQVVSLSKLTAWHPLNSCRQRGVVGKLSSSWPWLENGRERLAKPASIAVRVLQRTGLSTPTHLSAEQHIQGCWIKRCLGALHPPKGQPRYHWRFQGN